MRLNKLFFWLSIVLFTLLLASCGNKTIELKSINNIDFDHSKEQGSTILTNITLYNPNNVKLTIQDVDIDVYIGDVFLGKLEASETIIVNKKGNFSSEFSINIKKKNILLAGASFLGFLGKGSVELSLKGSLHVKYMFFNKNIKIKHSEKVKLK